MKIGFIYIFAIALLFLYGCSGENEKQPEQEVPDPCIPYKQKVGQLEGRLLSHERMVDRVEQAVFELSQHHSMLTAKFRIIQKNKADAGKEQLLKRTASEINLLFARDQRVLDTLRQQIYASNQPQTTLLPLVESLQNMITQQEWLFVEQFANLKPIQSQVVLLQEKIKQKEVELKSMESRIENQVEVKTAENRSVYYLVGTRDELVRAKAIQKKGGILGLGSSVILSDRLEEMFFQTADYQFLKDISLGNTRKAELISTHPKGSYLWLDTPGERYLQITNPQKFWSASRFLVVEVD